MKTQGSPFFNAIEEAFKAWLERLGYAASTIKGHQRRIRYFFLYLKNNQITNLEAIDSKVITGYENHLDQRSLSSATIGLYLTSLRLFDQYLEKYGYPPIIRTRLRITPGMATAKVVLSQQEVKQLYEATDASVYGYRERALLALYYGCGLRASEGLQLELQDLDFKSGLLQVRKAKNHRQRYVPMSEKVKQDLQQWLHYGRGAILKTASQQVLIHTKGAYKTATGLNDSLKKLLEKAGIPKPATLHSLRHSIATHLLENGMGLEQIRQFLGHRSLEVTQQYTHIVYGGI
jgi:integrase/recombinase XerD